jgi:HSP20 family molecular chaperone IbpA
MQLVKYNQRNQDLGTFMDRLFSCVPTFKSWDLGINTEYRETDLEINFDVPGLTKEQIEISFDKDSNTVTVKGESKTRKINKSVTLETEVDENTATCKLENGVLTITFKKSKEEINQIRKIPISG